MQQSVTETEQTRGSGGLSMKFYRRNTVDEYVAKAAARRRVLEHFLEHRSRETSAKLFSLPGAFWHFEKAWLSSYTGQGAVVGFEQDPQIYSLAVDHMPGTPYSEEWRWKTTSYTVWHTQLRSGRTCHMLPVSVQDYLQIGPATGGLTAATRAKRLSTFAGANLVWWDLMTTVTSPVTTACLQFLRTALDLKSKTIPFAITFTTQRDRNEALLRKIHRLHPDKLQARIKYISNLLNKYSRRRFTVTGSMQYGSPSTTGGGSKMCLLYGLLT